MEASESDLNWYTQVIDMLLKFYLLVNYVLTKNYFRYKHNQNFSVKITFQTSVRDIW